MCIPVLFPFFMANILKRSDSKYWIATFTDSVGRQLKRSTKLLAVPGNKKAAQALAVDFERAAAGDLTVKQATAVIGDLMEAQGKTLVVLSVRQWVQRWTDRQEKQVKPATFSFYEATGRKWVEWLKERADAPLNSQTVQSLIEYRDFLTPGISPQSVNNRMSLLGMILKAARMERLIDENPMEWVKPLKEDMEVRVARQPFTIEHLQAVLAVADEEWRSMVLWGAYTGQRLADVAMLQWEKIDLPGRKVSLRTRKTGRYQILPMADPLAEHALVWQEGRTARAAAYGEALAGYVHPRAAGHITRTGLSARLSNQFSEILVKAGIRAADAVERRKSRGIGRDAKRAQHSLTFHSLRHTATSWMKMAGIPASVVMDFIGHDDAAMSQHYTQVGDSEMRKAADSLPRI